MGGLADQRNAMLCKKCRLLDRQRKQMAAGFDCGTPKDEMRLSFGGIGQFIIA